MFAQFPAEWADPTNTIARVLLIALGVVIAFPYLPASGSPAFAGVSVLMGVVLSLASSSSLSNMIAGLVLTYAGAFRLGDRVKVGDAFGDIVETVAARHAHPHDQERGDHDSQRDRPRQLGHQLLAPGQDARAHPPHERHDRLRRPLADRCTTCSCRQPRPTPGLLPDPSPFVWQTALNDFYVTYEINAYTDAPHAMSDIYAALHRNIQDAFYAAGVEIMSPHFTSLRDGNTVAIPEAYRAGRIPRAAVSGWTASDRRRSTVNR